MAAVVNYLDPRIPHLMEQVKAEIAQRTTEEGLDASSAVSPELIHECVREICDDIDLRDEAVLAELERMVQNDLLGYGPLQQFLDDETVTEIMVNAYDEVYVERRGEITRVEEVLFNDEGDVAKIIDRIATQNSRQCNAAQPYMDARLPDGSRVNAIIPPLARFGNSLTIRKFPSERMTAPDLIRNGSVDIDIINFLKSAVEARCNILVSGGTGAGKTTLLNILAGFIQPDHRVITIEDTAELQLAVEDWVSLEAREANSDGSGEVNIHQLVVNSLRMRPDRIIVGECRSSEAVEMLQAMNTGHDGSLTTVHANDTKSAFLRLGTMVQSSTNLTMENINLQISSAIQLVVQIKRYLDGTRKISEVLALRGGLEGSAIVTTPLFEFVQTGIDGNGNVMGYHDACGNPCPEAIVERMTAMGAYYTPEWFIPKGEN